MSSNYWSYSPKTFSKNYDVLIVGAGYVGLSTAYWLKKFSPELRVAIIDKEGIGAGASGKNAGFLTKGSLLFYAHLTETWGEEKALALYHYAQDSIRMAVDELDLTSSSIATPTSSWTFLRSDEAIKRVNKIPNSIKNFFQEYNLKEAPVFQDSSMKSVFVQREEFSVSPIRLLNSLENKIKEFGVEFIFGAQVLKIDTNAVPHLQTTLGNFSAEKIIFCTNGYSSLIPELNLNIKFQRAQMMAMKLKKPIFASGLFYDPEERVYFKFDKPGIILIGGKRLIDEANENTMDASPSFVIQKALENYVINELKLGGEKITGWAGIMGFTESELPYVGAIPHLKSCYTAAGFSGHGMGWGFRTAHELASNILGKLDQPLLSKMVK